MHCRSSLTISLTAAPPPLGVERQGRQAVWMEGRAAGGVRGSPSRNAVGDITVGPARTGRPAHRSFRYHPTRRTQVPFRCAASDYVLHRRQSRPSRTPPPTGNETAKPHPVSRNGHLHLFDRKRPSNVTTDTCPSLSTAPTLIADCAALAAVSGFDMKVSSHAWNISAASCRSASPRTSCPRAWLETT